MSTNAANGNAPREVLTIALDRDTGKVSASMPKDLAVAYAMLRAGLDMVMKQALNPEPERKVKTLDEFGFRR